MTGMNGLFITFEGGEGSGKTTQIQFLKEWVKDNVELCGLCLTREPGGTEGAELIRALLLNGPAGRWQTSTEAMLMSASRREHVFNVVQPALDRGDIVICDRFTDSTHVYQGYVGGVSAEFLEGLDQLSCEGLVPDLTLLLDIDSKEGLARTVSRGVDESRFETKGEVFHERVRRGFIERASRHSNRIVIIEAARPTDDIALDVIDVVKPLLLANGFSLKAPS